MATTSERTEPTLWPLLVGDGTPEGMGGDPRDVTSPFTGAVVGRTARASAEQVTAAIDAAAHVMANAPLPAHERARILDAVARRLGETAEEGARLLADEAGKPITAARTEVARAQSTFTFAAVEARRLSGHQVPMDASPAGVGKLAFTLREPIGVVAAITPFNFPLNLVAHKLAPALAAGCAVVLKPAGATPLSALRLARIMREEGLPAGWINVVTGSASEVGDALLGDERVRKVSFTGSAAVGWELAARAPKQHVTLELGNATPLIVAADADLDAAVAAAAAGGYGFAGQSCISVQRVYVERPAYDRFVERFVARVASLGVGDPSDDDTVVGPMIDAGERDRAAAWIAEDVAAGARLLCGGEVRDDGLLAPTVLADIAPPMHVAAEEVFAPIVGLAPYDTLEDAIRLANDTGYGLQAGIFTSNVTDALFAARHLAFGGVTVNESPTFRADQQPYGGVKESGVGREGPRYAVELFTETKVVILDLGGR